MAKKRPPVLIRSLIRLGLDRPALEASQTNHDRKAKDRLPVEKEHNMDDKAVASGFYWHVHHDMLMEYCYNFEERVKYIKSNKPEEEQALRLRLFKPVRELSTEYDKVCAEYDKVCAEYDKVCVKNYEAIEEQHRLECPDCPWDGKSIF